MFPVVAGAMAWLLVGCSGGGGSADAPDSGGDSGGGSDSGSGKVTLTWTRPTTNEDGSELTDLAGFHVYYGQLAGDWSTKLDVPGASSSVEIQDLRTGTWYFAITSYNTGGIESVPSGVVSTTI
jgi:hypothetical protein